MTTYAASARKYDIQNLLFRHHLLAAFRRTKRTSGNCLAMVARRWQQNSASHSLNLYVLPCSRVCLHGVLLKVEFWTNCPAFSISRAGLLGSSTRQALVTASRLAGSADSSPAALVTVYPRSAETEDRICRTVSVESSSETRWC